MAKVSKEREPASMVAQNSILCETISKEMRASKLYTSYSINPFKKFHTLTGKPNSFHDTEDGEEDVHFRDVIKRAHVEPTKKYIQPMTESQEIGWITQPLIDTDKTDRRIYFPRQNSSITKYMDAAWKPGN